ncbi:MAG: protein translocase subunit SecD [Myxococcota bacterium]
MSGLGWRLGAVLATVALFSFLTAANFIDEETRLASPVLPDDGLRLGLDLQGGIHRVVGVKLEEAELQELVFLKDALLEEADEDPQLSVSNAVVENGVLVVSPRDDGAGVKSWADDSRSLSLVSEEAGRLEYTLEDQVRQDVRERGMEQVLEVLRLRIADPIQGIPDSVVTRQGDDRVLVQVPGGQIDRDRLDDLLEVTGFLEFKIVQDLADNEKLLNDRYPTGLPPGTKIVSEQDPEDDRKLTAYLLPEEPDLTGDFLTDARVAFDRQQRPIVSFSFNSEGARRFGELTGANINEQLAIVLDDRVYSAPAIRSRIGARGQIEGRFTTEEARDLAVVLRSGSLPIPVVIEEERTVGPALGQDSITRGYRASILGLIVIIGFVVGYYRLSGGYASLALAANLVMLMGIMSLFEATLTMPGIAGIVLTVGMAVDANVIIFERIREELRSGKAPRAAIATGYNKTFWTIMDANITTFITALVLFEFGTGPIQGFAVTLAVGIVTSVFSALVLTRLMFSVHPGTQPVEQLSI